MIHKFEANDTFHKVVLEEVRAHATPINLKSQACKLVTKSEFCTAAARKSIYNCYYLFISVKIKLWYLLQYEYQNYL